MQRARSFCKVLPNQKHGEIPGCWVLSRVPDVPPNHNCDITQGALSKNLARIGQDLVILDKIRLFIHEPKEATLQKPQLLCHRRICRQDCGLVSKLEMRVSQLVVINFISQQTSEKGISISVVSGQDKVFLNPCLFFLPQCYCTASPR